MCSHAHLHAHGVYIYCARRLETHSRTYVHASFFGALESPRIVYTYTVRGDSRHTHMCAYAHAVLAYLHVLACTPARAWCIHTLCAETRDTRTYTCAHTELAYLHTCTRMVCMHTSCAETRDTLTYAYIHIHGVPGDIRVLACTPTRAWCIHTLCAETRCTPTYAYAHALPADIHAHTHTSTCMRMVYNTSCAETRDTLACTYAHAV
jgi:hypothetical protein